MMQLTHAWRLKASNTDSFCKGVDVMVGKSNNKLCPVSAIMAYLVVRGNRTGFLFQFQDGRLLTKARFIDHIRELGKAGHITQEIMPGTCSASGQPWQLGHVA